ncbi:hypothetical protein GGR57DRAFT_368634 [Xylariaceae sp. FL1272]|nr:hypothetical protein GGR57DRAFT_368634 [Xylariaceae sp. FL1272]
MPTVQSDANYYPVHLGVWTNWSRGAVLGPTLTVTRQQGDLLIAFTALFITWVADRGWRILSLSLHRHFSSPTPQGALHHQNQAILRNFDSQDSISQLGSLLWVNRNKHNRIYKPLLLLVFSAAYTIFFAAASGFSSQISTAVGTEVLIKSSNCGWFGSDIELTDADAVTVAPKLYARNVGNAANYALQCYSDDSSGILDCSRLPVKKIQSTIDTAASCPFEGDVCRSDANIIVDSGFMNSQEHFGLNTPLKDRMFVRIVDHCAPMKTEGFTSRRVSTAGNITVYHYGNITLDDGLADYMGTAKSIESQYSYIIAKDTLQMIANYQLDAEVAYVQDGSVNSDLSDFVPASSIFPLDADLMVVFLAGNGVLHTAPSADDWYRVSPTESSIGQTQSNSTSSFKFFHPLEDASPLGCTLQWQFCRENEKNCGTLGSLSDATDSAASLFGIDGKFDIDAQYSTAAASNFHYFATTIQRANTIPGILSQLGPTSLKSQDELAAARQGPLPSNQWQLDVAHWVDIELAALQLAFLNAAYLSPTETSLLKFRKSFDGDEAKLCNNQKIRSTAYSSFNLFGLLFVYILGFLVTSVSFILEPLLLFLYRRFGYKAYETLEWTTNSTLQLQRLAHEARGFGTWSNCTQKVPVARGDDLLANLDLADTTHPVLTRSLTRSYLDKRESNTTLRNELAAVDRKPSSDSKELS